MHAIGVFERFDVRWLHRHTEIDTAREEARDHGRLIGNDVIDQLRECRRASESRGERWIRTEYPFIRSRSAHEP